MANLFFKRGLRSSLSAAQLQDGAVYVTTDERAMYVDYLPEATVDNPNPTVQRIRLGDFREYADFTAIMNIPVAQLDTSALYYAAAENILCKWTGDVSANNGGWVQVNPQASLNAIIKKIWNGAVTVTGGTRIETQLRDANNIGPTGKVSYVSGNGALNVSGATDNTTGNATVTFTAKDVTEDAEISLRENATTGYLELVITNTKAGTAADGTAINTSSESIIALDGQGITLSQSNGVLTLTNEAGVQSVTNAFNANGAFTTQVTLLGGVSRTSAALTPTIRYGNTPTDAVFANGVATLNVYTKAEVDDKISNELRAANAMTFKGVVDSLTDLPTSGVRNGDTYKASEDGSYWLLDPENSEYGFENCRLGDMFIAVGTEGTDGTIPTENLSWVYIPSGNDDAQSFRFRYNAANHTIELVNANDASMGSIAAGTDLVVGGTGNAMTIGHANVTRTDTTGTDATQSSGLGDLEINVVTGVTTSATGHVTGVELTKLTIADEFNKLSALSVTPSIDQSTGDAKIRLDVSDAKGNHAANDVRLHSESLTFSVNGSTTNVEMQWGTF